MEGYYYWFQCNDQGAYITKKPVNELPAISPDATWNVIHKLEINNENKTLEIQGRLLPHGVIAGQWGDVHYQLVFQKESTDTWAESLGQLERPVDGYSSTTSKSYFSNFYNSPIKLDGLSDGQWTIQVVGRAEHMIFSSGPVAKLKIENSSVELTKLSN